MKLFTMIVLFFLPIICSAQNVDKGIRFQSLSWNELTQEAKRLNKYIFVDCYASWCIPCKKMDKEVYTIDSIGEFVNKNYLSTKIQFDTTTRDNQLVKQFYSVANSLKGQYHISAYPTYLFFSPDGQIVHKEIGGKTAGDFLGLMRTSLQPENQIYVQMQAFKNGQINIKKLPELSNAVRTIVGDAVLAEKMDNYYSKNYLEKLSTSELLEKDKIEFLQWHPDLLTSDSRYFNFFRQNIKAVDVIMSRKGYANQMIDFVIYKEEIDPVIYPNRKVAGAEPNWTAIEKTIKKKYGSINAARSIVNAKIWWFGKKNNYEQQAKYQIEKIDRFGLDTSVWGRLGTNNMIYDLIFKHCSDKKTLKAAASIMKTVVEIEGDDADYLDTYANILYKSGEKNEAIKMQEKAAMHKNASEGIKERLVKMKRNLPTWDN